MDNRITKVDVVEQETGFVSQHRPSPTEKDKRMGPAERITESFASLGTGYCNNC